MKKLSLTPATGWTDETILSHHAPTASADGIFPNVVVVRDTISPAHTNNISGFASHQLDQLSSNMPDYHLLEQGYYRDRRPACHLYRLPLVIG